MMKHFQNQMRQLAQMAGQGQARPRHGIVTSYDPHTYSAKVQLQPEGVETGWLPVASAWIGNDWGMFCPPMPGDMVEVQFQEDGMEAGYVCGRFFNDQDRPLAVPSGEFWLVHKSGAFFKLTNDGKATFDDAHGAHVTLNGDGTISSSGTWTHTGDFTASGQISDQSGTKGTLQHVRDIYDVHTHGGVQAGSGNTSSPNDTL